MSDKAVSNLCWLALIIAVISILSIPAFIICPQITDINYYSAIHALPFTNVLSSSHYEYKYKLLAYSFTTSFIATRHRLQCKALYLNAFNIYHSNIIQQSNQTIDINILTNRTKWNGPIGKLEGWLTEIKRLKAYDFKLLSHEELSHIIIMLYDGGDVLILKNLSSILHAYLHAENGRFKNKILVSSERRCFDEPGLIIQDNSYYINVCDDIVSIYNKSDHRRLTDTYMHKNPVFMNVGMMIGPLLKMEKMMEMTLNLDDYYLKHIPKINTLNDQVLIQYVFAYKYSKDMVIDYNSTIFQSLGYTTNKEVVIEKSGIKNTFTNTYPMMLHVNGGGKYARLSDFVDGILNNSLNEITNKYGLTSQSIMNRVSQQSINWIENSTITKIQINNICNFDTAVNHINAYFPQFKSD